MLSKESVKRKDKSPRVYFILAGVILIIIALAIPASTFAPVFKAEINYQISQKKQIPTEITPIDPEFSIIIPKINANTKVIKNVDPFDSKIYQRALTQGVAHAKDTSTPDKAGNTFIFAHSAGNWYQANQFNAVFYLLNKLETGDEIIVYYQSKKYIYSVDEIKFVKPDETNYLSNQLNTNKLTLMTCWPPGTTLKRLVVISTLKND
jgi:LPXTG-site transpeptidase (sortase) family protein